MEESKKQNLRVAVVLLAATLPAVALHRLLLAGLLDDYGKMWSRWPLNVFLLFLIWTIASVTIYTNIQEKVARNPPLDLRLLTDLLIVLGLTALCALLGLVLPAIRIIAVRSGDLGVFAATMRAGGTLVISLPILGLDALAFVAIAYCLRRRIEQVRLAKARWLYFSGLCVYTLLLVIGYLWFSDLPIGGRGRLKAEMDVFMLLIVTCAFFAGGLGRLLFRHDRGSRADPNSAPSMSKEPDEKERVAALEAKHRRGYERHPVTEDEFSAWESEQDWGEE